MQTPYIELISDIVNPTINLDYTDFNLNVSNMKAKYILLYFHNYNNLAIEEVRFKYKDFEKDLVIDWNNEDILVADLLGIRTYILPLSREFSNWVATSRIKVYNSL